MYPDCASEEFDRFGNISRCAGPFHGNLPLRTGWIHPSGLAGNDRLRCNGIYRNGVHGNLLCEGDRQRMNPAFAVSYAALAVR